MLDNNQEQAQFWWNNIVNALADFDFEDLCQIIPVRNLTEGSLEICFIRENDLRTLMKEKQIPEENYSIDYGTMYGGGVLIVGDVLDDMKREELSKQKQKGLRIVYKTKRDIQAMQ